MPPNNASPRRCSRSLDLDSHTKAAAWVWHLHGKPDSTDGKFVPLTRSSERQQSRFRLEASQAASAQLAPASQGVWDCGSKLYDTFELVSFSGRLDRNLVGIPASTGAANSHHAQSPLHQSSGLLRTLSLPRNMLVRDDSESRAGSTLNTAHNSVCQSDGKDVSTKKHTRKWSIGRLVKILKKATTLHNRLRRRKLHQKEHDEGRTQGRHFHHHYHYHHHHYMHSLDGIDEVEKNALYKYQANDRCSSVAPRAESARLSSETISKICLDRTWL